MNRVPYSKAIGSILWATVVLWPDTAYAVGVLSQFIQNLGEAHWEAVKRVISYLESMKDLCLTFGGNKQTLLEGYCNLDWASQPHCHSISGLSFHYGQGAILWSAKKQNIITLSSTKAEYVAETHAAKEGIWLKTFIREVVGGDTGPITIMEDNQGAIALAKDNKFHTRTKHIDLRYHFIHEAVKKKQVIMKYIPTTDNVADIFTKALAKPKYIHFVKLLGLAIMKEWRAWSQGFAIWWTMEPHWMESCDQCVHVHWSKLTFHLRGSVEYIGASSACLFHLFSLSVITYQLLNIFLT